MNEPRRTRWEELNDNADHLRKLMVLFFVLAFITAAASFWSHELKWVAGYMALLGMHASTASGAVEARAAMQARIDMILVARGQEPE